MLLYFKYRSIVLDEVDRGFKNFLDTIYIVFFPKTVIDDLN